MIPEWENCVNASPLNIWWFDVTSSLIVCWISVQSCQYYFLLPNPTFLWDMSHHQVCFSRKCKYVSSISDCPSGTHRHNINGCATCPIGTYMDHPNRATSCTECPEMTTTSSEGSVSEQDCVGEYVYTENRESSLCQLCGANGGTTTGFGALKTNDSHDANCIVTGVYAGSYQLKTVRMPIVITRWRQKLSFR